MNCLIKD